MTKALIGTKDTWGVEWPPRGPALMEVVRKTYGNRAMLAFSCGKDSIAAWLAIREYFDEVVPVYFELVPGMEFIRETLDYYEGVFGCKILRLPHPTLYTMLRTYLYQPPSRIGLISSWELPADYDYAMAHSLVREQAGLAKNVPCANGIRAADSPMRRVSLMSHGPVSYNTKQWSPVWEFNKADILGILDRHAIKLPVDYRIFGRTFDGLDYRFLKPLKEQLPDDYRRLLEWFPLADLAIWQVERGSA